MYDSILVATDGSDDASVAVEHAEPRFHCTASPS